MLPLMFRERLKIVLAAIQGYSADSNPKLLEPLVPAIIEDLHLPSSDPLLEDICRHPYTAREYARAVLVSQHLALDEPKNADAKTLWGLLRKTQSNEPQVRIRQFSPTGGRYYGFPLYMEDSAYLILNAEPVLITNLTKDWQNELLFHIELGVLARLEVKLLATICFSLYNWHGPSFYFMIGPKPLDLPISLIGVSDSKIVPDILPRLTIAQEVFKRLHRLERTKSDFTEAQFAHFDFRPHKLDDGRLQRFYMQFSLDDYLALRTAYVLLKSAALWVHGGSSFGEEATANLFFGIEGCLHLIHRRLGKSPDFEINPVVQHIKSTFSEKPGYPEMIEDAYDKRIQIVHPNYSEEIGWLPNLEADDFYENYGMANDFLYYAITGDKLPDSN